MPNNTSTKMKNATLTTINPISVRDNAEGGGAADGTIIAGGGGL